MSNKKIAIVRYLAIIGMILGLVVYKKNNISFYTVLLILAFILNNQLRFYILKRKNVLMLFSICIELIIAYVIYNFYGGILFFSFFTSIFDSAFVIKGKASYVSLLLSIAATIVSCKRLELGEIATVLSAYAILFLLADYIKEEHNRKIEAQELYDRLRISEDKLKKANSDLECYAKSVEELTLLRERNRISREIHDSVGHSLSTIIIQLGAIEKIAESSGTAAAQMAKNLGDFAKTSLQEVRAAVRELKPREFEEYEGLLSVEELTKNFQKLTGVEIKFGFSREKWSLNADKSLVIYRAVQEFLSNSARHGKATKVDIFMNFTKENLIITMQDNGVGASQIVKGIGLKSISERVNEIGGNISYSSEIGQGFFMKIVLYKAEKLAML